jgi:uncharacterized membrane protein YccC
MQPAATTHPTPFQSFWRTVTKIDRTVIQWWMAARNALGVVVPLAAGVASGNPASGVVGAVGALNVAAADGIDSYRRRAARMLTSSLLCGVAVTLGALSAHNEAIAVLMRMLWAIAAGLLVCLGQTAGDLGMISLVVFIIYTAQSLTPERAVAAGAIALAGGLVQTGLAIALWPIRGLRPERLIIADFYDELARVATLPANPYEEPLASRQSAQAQEALEPWAGDHHVEVERYFVLVSQAERIRLSLLALTRAQVRIRREEGSRAAAAAIQEFLEQVSRALASVACCLRDECGSPTSPRDLELPAAEASGTLAPLLSEAHYQADALTGQLRAAAELATSATPTGEIAFADREMAKPWLLRLTGRLATLRANLSLDSSALRHGVRLAMCIGIADLIAHTFSLPRSYWIGMTIALVLKPDFGNTFSRGALRLAGTYVGLILATVLFHFVSPGSWGDVAWIGLLVFAQRSWGRTNYGLLVVVISALIVFLFSLAGLPPKDVIAARALNTTIGGALAMIIYLLWPTRERTHTSQAIAGLFDSYRGYFRAVANGGPDLDRFRLETRRARSNVEAAVDRLRAEPFADSRQLTILSAILASAHRFMHAVMALDAGSMSAPAVPVRDAFRAFAQDVEAALTLLAERMRGQSGSEHGPNLREAQRRLGASEPLLTIETDRMTNSLNTLLEQVNRLG